MSWCLETKTVNTASQALEMLATEEVVSEAAMAS
jgi:hypothetical protein